MNAPVTSKLEIRFRAHGLDPAQYQGLIADLMRYVYDEKDRAVDEVLGSPFEAKASAFAEQIDQLQNAMADDIHGIYIDSQRIK